MLLRLSIRLWERSLPGRPLGSSRYSRPAVTVTVACTCGQTWLDESLNLRTLLTSRDPLMHLKTLAVGAYQNTIICSSCKTAVLDVLAKRREVVWQSLREDFD